MSEFNVTKRYLIITKAAFGTTLIEETDEFLKFHYPERGVRFSRELNDWETGPFPVTPHGFSGGAFFGIEHTAKGNKSAIERIEYNLLGIQYEWNSVERWVHVVPIKQWCDLLRQRCGVG
jgi:hypothetical protein